MLRGKHQIFFYTSQELEQRDLIRFLSPYK